MLNRYFFIRWLICPLIGLYIKEIKDIENFPKNGSYIIVANHNSVFDGFALAYLYTLRRRDGRVAVVARLKARRNNQIDKAMMSFISVISSIFWMIIDTDENGKISKVLNALNKGHSFLILPEGRVNTNSKVMLKARTGAARIALLSKVPILPIGLADTEKVLPLNAYLPRLKRLAINIGKPISFAKYYGKADDKKTLEKVTRIIMKEVEKLSGRSYPY